MLERLLSSVMPSDPIEMIIGFIEGEDITLTVGDKLRLEVVVTRDPDSKNVLNFRGRLVRGGRE